MIFNKCVASRAKALVTVAILSIMLGGISHNARAEIDESNVLFTDQSLSMPLKSRMIKNKGDTIIIYYNSCKLAGEITFKEEERNSRIHNELLQVAKKLAGPAPSATDLCITKSATYTTRYSRSIMTVTAPLEGDKVISRSIIVGPIERLSLGIDLPVGNRRTLQYDEASRSLVPKDSSAQLFLSLNVSGGDVLTEDDELHGLSRVSLKIMVRASSHPLDSYGIGVGYRLPKFKSLDLEGFSIFAAYLTDKQDMVVGGLPQLDNAKRRVWRAGISYDLGTALKWVKW